MQKLIPPLIRIEDSKIEQMLRGGGGSPRHPSRDDRGRTNGNWTQLALMSACAAVRDFCIVPSDERTEAMVEEACMRRFSNRHYRFHSDEHFLQTKSEIIRHLQTFFVHEPADGAVMACFETFTAYVDDLDMELSQHFHLISTFGKEEGEDGYIVQKLVADDNAESLELYFHMTVVFGMCAFGRLPCRIEAMLPLTGRRIVWKPEWRQWPRSLDYMRLVKSMLDGPETRSGCCRALPAI